MKMVGLKVQALIKNQWCYFGSTLKFKLLGEVLRYDLYYSLTCNENSKFDFYFQESRESC
jgi:hypothetical protein